MKLFGFITCLFFSLLHGFSQQHDGVLKNSKISNIKNLQDTGYDITYQRLEFEVDPAVNHITGKETNYFIAREDQLKKAVIYLSDSLQVDSVIHKTGHLAFVHDSDRLDITIPALALDQKDSFTICYHGFPKVSGSRSFFTKLHDSIPVMWTLSEPYGAPDWMPAKMSLNDKVDSLDMYITAPEQYKAAGNGLLVSETQQGGNKTAHWKHRHPITPYLIAFAVTNYAAYTDTITVRNITIPMLNYVYPESLEVAKKNTPLLVPVFQFFDSLFAPYPFSNEKYGHAQISAAGAMEHQTMTYTTSFGIDLLAHELAHQWFGNFITCATWNDIFVNEAFATWCTGLIHERGYGGYSFRKWIADDIWVSTYRDSGSVYVPQTDSVKRIFDYQLTYCKGAMLLHMLRWVIGDEAIFQGIRNYLNDPAFANGFAGTDDFKKHIEETSEKNLDEFFNDWYFGQGFPRYSLLWKQNEDGGGELTIYQKPSHPSVKFFEMNVPVKFAGSGRDTTIVFDHTYTGERFFVNLDFQVSRLIVDPDLRILTTHYDTLFISSVIVKDSVKIYPNPAHEYIDIKLPPQSDLLDFKLFNLAGQQIYPLISEKLSRTFQLDISLLPNGTYILVVNVSGNICKKKFVKR